MLRPAVLAAELLAGAYFVARQLPGLWMTRWVQDDAYISFRYARNMLHGHGLVYNIGERVEGYTNFLWTVISAVPMAFGAVDPVPFMHVFSLALWIGSYLLLLLLAVSLFRSRIWMAPLAVIPLTYQWSFNMWFFSGMETPLISFLTVLVLFFFAQDPERRPFSLFWTSLAGVLLIMTRPDATLGLAALALVAVLLYGPRLLRERRWRSYVVLPLLPMLLIYLPYTIWRVSYYGSFYPNTYYAKAAYLTFYDRGWQYLDTYLDVYRLWPYFGVFVAGALVAPAGVARRFLWGSLAMIATVFFYVVRLGGDFMEWRFVTPVSSLLYFGSGISAAVLVQQTVRLLAWALTRRRGAGLALAGVLGWTAGVAVVSLLAYDTIRADEAAQGTKIPGQETIALLRRYCDPGRFDWVTVGKVLDGILPKNITMATTSAGAIPFYCDRTCVDLHGLTDARIGHGPIDEEHRGRMGHEHWLKDYGAMRARGIDVFLYWADPKSNALSLLNPPKDNEQMVSVQLPDGRYVEFLILNDKAFDMEALRADPRLVLFGSRGMQDPQDFYALRDRFASLDVVDVLNVENPESEKTHEFHEIFLPKAPYGHNWHTKLLGYGPPYDQIVLSDAGRRLYHSAEWTVHDVRADADMVIVVRYDHTGGGVYRLEVNGHEVPGRLGLVGGVETWDEAWTIVPAEMLLPGDNQLRLTRSAKSHADSEIYHFWFLQRPQEPACHAEIGGAAAEPEVQCRMEVGGGALAATAEDTAAAPLVEGFARVIRSTNRDPRYGGHRGPDMSYFAYARDEPEEVVWETAPSPASGPVEFAFEGSSGEDPGRAALFVDGRFVLLFDTGRDSGNLVWTAGGYRLEFVPRARIAGYSGYYRLRVPAGVVQARTAAVLGVEMVSGERRSWFMLKAYGDTIPYEKVSSAVP